MILLYSMLLAFLGMIKFLLGVRARGLERKFMRLAAAVDRMLREPAFKPGNSSKADPCVEAKRVLMLGELAQARDCVEAKYFAWQRWTDRFTGWIAAVRAWKGKKLPYTMGAVDVWMAMCLVDYLGVGEYFSTLALVQAVMAKLTE